MDDEGGFIKFFNKLPETDAVRIFERSDFFTVHGSDAHFVAQTVYKTNSVIRNLGTGNNPLPSCTLTTTAFRNFLREMLFQQGKRVEIWSTQTRGGKSWEIARQASPGNLQDVEEDLGGHIDSSPIIVAVKISGTAESKNVGVAFADASVREIGVSEFIDNDVYSNLESMIIQLGAKECIIQSNENKKDYELNKVYAVFDRCGIPITPKKSGDFSTKDVKQDLSRILAGEVTTLPQTDLKLAMGACSALIKYLGVSQSLEVIHLAGTDSFQLMSDSLNFGQYQLYQHDLRQYMKLDASALKALNLMPGPRDGSKTMSLYGLLNKCKTTIGSRLLAQWLKQPLMSLEEIERRHILVEAFYEDTELRQTMQEENLKSIPDLYRLSKRFQRNLARLEDVVQCYQVAVKIPDFVATLEGVMDEKYRDPLDAEYTNKLREASGSLRGLQELVETTIDLDAIDNHEYKIKPEFNDELKNIGERLEELKKEMRREHRKVGQALGQDIEKKLFLEEHKVHGWVFRLTRNEAGCIRNKKEYKECSTQKNGVYFTTDSLSSLRREHDQQTSNYNSTQSGLVAEVVNVASTYCPVLEKLAAVVAHMDVIVRYA